MPLARKGNLSSRSRSRMTQSGLRPGTSTSNDEEQALLRSSHHGSEDHDDSHHPISSTKRKYMVGMFACMAALVYADQNILAPHLTQAANDFRFSSTQRDEMLGGYIMASFFMVGAPAAIVIGWASDNFNRRNLLFLVVIMGSGPCLATYWVTDFWQLLVLRTMTGISVGGCFPLIFSLMGDLFPPSQRCGMAAFVQIAVNVGMSLGQAVSDLTGQTNWRVPFMVVATPSLIAATVMLLTTEEPPRGGFEEALKSSYAAGEEYKETVTWEGMKQLLKIPSNWLIIVQGLPGCLPAGMAITFLNDYLSQDKGFSIHMATTILLVTGLGATAGTLVGGQFGQWLYNKRKEYLPLMIGASVATGAIPFFYLINAPLTEISIWFTLGLTTVFGFLGSLGSSNIQAIMINVNEPELRGTAFGLHTITDDLGKGLGPAMVAWCVKYLGRQFAFNVAAFGAIPCSVLLASMALCMRKDEASMQARLHRKISAWQASQQITPASDLDQGRSSSIKRNGSGSARHRSAAIEALLAHGHDVDSRSSTPDSFTKICNAKDIMSGNAKDFEIYTDYEARADKIRGELPRHHGNRHAAGHDVSDTQHAHHGHSQHAKHEHHLVDSDYYSGSDQELSTSCRTKRRSKNIGASSSLMHNKTHVQYNGRTGSRRDSFDTNDKAATAYFSSRLANASSGTNHNNPRHGTHSTATQHAVPRRSSAGHPNRHDHDADIDHHRVHMSSAAAGRHDVYGDTPAVAMLDEQSMYMQAQQEGLSPAVLRKLQRLFTSAKHHYTPLQ